MAVPDYQTLMRPVLEGYAAGARTVPELIPRIREEFGISEDEAAELLPSGKQTIISNRIHWARQYLAKAGCIRSIKRGHFEITNTRRKMLSDHPDRIDNGALSSMPDFVAWRERSGASQGDQASRSEALETVENRTISSETPQDLIERAAAEIGSSLAEEVLNAVLSLSPTRFEHLILDVLRAMGYGGGLDTDYRATPASGDGGIDGVINEDALGLDAVYIQAKRYASGNRVGREALQAFVGSLTGEGASKGVFVTTSSFSRHAIDYATRLQNHRIVLINGERLARLMIAHDVGVRAAQTYVVKEIDENYFPDD